MTGAAGIGAAAIDATCLGVQNDAITTVPYKTNYELDFLIHAHLDTEEGVL
jgi:hypothetical protein